VKEQQKEIMKGLAVNSQQSGSSISSTGLLVAKVGWKPGPRSLVVFSFQYKLPLGRGGGGRQSSNSSSLQVKWECMVAGHSGNTEGNTGPEHKEGREIKIVETKLGFPTVKPRELNRGRRKEL
jgi:hypothetical protein